MLAIGCGLAAASSGHAREVLCTPPAVAYTPPLLAGWLRRRWVVALPPEGGDGGGGGGRGSEAARRPPAVRPRIVVVAPLPRAPLRRSPKPARAAARQEDEEGGQVELLVWPQGRSQQQAAVGAADLVVWTVPDLPRPVQLRDGGGLDQQAAGAGGDSGSDVGRRTAAGAAVRPNGGDGCGSSSSSADACGRPAPLRVWLPLAGLRPGVAFVAVRQPGGPIGTPCPVLLLRDAGVSAELSRALGASPQEQQHLRQAQRQGQGQLEEEGEDLPGCPRQHLSQLLVDLGAWARNLEAPADAAAAGSPPPPSPPSSASCRHDDDGGSGRVVAGVHQLGGRLLAHAVGQGWRRTARWLLQVGLRVRHAGRASAACVRFLHVQSHAMGMAVAAGQGRHRYSRPVGRPVAGCWRPSRGMPGVSAMLRGSACMPAVARAHALPCVPSHVMGIASCSS